MITELTAKKAHNIALEIQDMEKQELTYILSEIKLAANNGEFNIRFEGEISSSVKTILLLKGFELGDILNGADNRVSRPSIQIYW